MDLRTLLEQMLANDAWRRVLNNPLAQFGFGARTYLGATLLPERNVPQNEYTESAIRFKTMMANDGTRYSPVGKKKGVLTGYMTVTLSNSDIGSEFTAADYDGLIGLLRTATGQAGNPPTMQAMSTLVKWADLTLNRPLLEKNELMRWQAIVNAQVLRVGPGGYRETIQYSDPVGQRVNAGGVWSNDSYDPYDDLSAMLDFMTGKGYTVNRIIAGRPVIQKLLNNALMRQRVGRISVAAGTVVGIPGRLSKTDLNAIMAENDLPAIEEYNLQYQTQTGTGFFLPRNVMVAVATTGRDETFLDLAANPTTLQNTVGYVGVGRPAGAATPGRVTNIESFNNKPPRIEGEAWQTSLPVILDPEAVYVIGNIS